MTSKTDILNELKEITPLAEQFSQYTPYQVPAGYFDALPAELLLRAKASATDTAAEELETLSPFLSGLSKKMPFETPAGYFEGLAGEVREKTLIQGKVIQGAFGKRLFRFAAAATVAGILFTGTWMLMKDKSLTDAALAAAETKNAIIEKDLLAGAHQISENEIVNYLDSTKTVATYDAVNPNAVIKEDDMLLMLADVSEEELQHYLDEDDSVKPLLN